MIMENYIGISTLRYHFRK